MNVSLLYFEGCPSWHEADDRLRQALAITGHVDTTITYVLVSTPEEAERLQFRGSPTVLVDDVDPFAEPNSATSGTRLSPLSDRGRRTSWISHAGAAHRCLELSLLP